MAFHEWGSRKIKRWLQRAFQEVLEPVVGKVKVITSEEAERDFGEEVFCNGICQQIRYSAIVVADISYDNTNVGYEVALAQNAGIPPLIFMKTNVGRRGGIPLDLQHLRVYRYTSYDDLVVHVRALAGPIKRRFDQLTQTGPRVEVLQ